MIRSTLKTDGQVVVDTTLGGISLREARELQAILGNLGIVALRRLLRGRFDRALATMRRKESEPRDIDYERGALDAVQEVDTVLCELDRSIRDAVRSGAQDDEGSDSGRRGRVDDEDAVDPGPGG